MKNIKRMLRRYSLFLFNIFAESGKWDIIGDVNCNYHNFSCYQLTENTREYFVGYGYDIRRMEKKMINNMDIIPALGIATWTIVMLVIIVILIAALVALGIYGKKLQAKQESTQKEMQAASQSVSLLVIDKKRMKIKDAGLPQIVLDQTPKYLRGQKLPIVKAKIGPKIMPLICDEKIFELIPVKKEIRATVSGIYIMGVKGLRSNLEAKPKKMKFSDKVKAKLNKDK